MRFHDYNVPEDAEALLRVAERNEVPVARVDRR
jgi:hypothetical protein